MTISVWSNDERMKKLRVVKEILTRKQKEERKETIKGYLTTFYLKRFWRRLVY